jgi:hypothetical protein
MKASRPKMLGELSADEAAQFLSGQSLLVLQVAIGDQLSLGMLRKPALTMSETPILAIVWPFCAQIAPKFVEGQCQLCTTTCNKSSGETSSVRTFLLLKNVRNRGLDPI